MEFFAVLLGVLVGFLIGLGTAKRHPLLEAETEAEVREAWAECCKLYSDAKRRLGSK